MFDFLSPKVPQLTCNDVKKLLDQKNESITLVDVRTPGEYQRGKIAGSINMPLNDISNHVPITIPDKNTKIIIYCLSGSRSVHAVDMLIKLGYTNVFDMKNGLLAWRANFFPVAE